MGQNRARKMKRRSSRQRKARRDSVEPRDAVDDLGPWEKPDKGNEFLTISTPPMYVTQKVTEVRRNSAGKVRRLHSIRLEDSIHPVPLVFDVPLIDVAINRDDFRRHWEKLTYLFSLPDPGSFPSVAVLLDDDQRQMARRFVQTCRSMAGYSVFNHSGGGLQVRMFEGEFNLFADFPTEEQFAGLSATFRQLHNDGESASYKKVYKQLERSAVGLENPARTDAIRVLKAWDNARKRLLRETVSTMVSRRLIEEASTGRPQVSEHTATLHGIVPEDLIKTYNYGDLLHWGDERGKLANLTADPNNEKFYKYCVLNSMISLAHLYFGFSVLVASSLRP